MSYCTNCAGLLAENSQLKNEVTTLLAALTEGVGIPASEDFAADLDTMANQLEGRLPVYADKIRAKSQAIRAAIAAARGKSG